MTTIHQTEPVSTEQPTATTRLSGHELFYEGAAYDAKGKYRVQEIWGGTGGTGSGKCSCGALSPELTSGAQRKAWHRGHKDQVRKGTNVD
jgi:hypothetical protein